MTRPGDGRPKVGDEAPLELELADVPRRLPRGNASTGGYGDSLGRGNAAPPTGTSPAPATPGPAGPTPSIAPAGPSYPPLSTTSGRSLLDEPSPWPRRVLALALLVGGALGGYWLVRRIFRPDVVSISSPYRSSTGVTVELPGRTGWHSDRRHRMKESNGALWMRGDAMYRAAKLEEANELAAVMRVHAPGAFARVVDPEQLRASLEAALRQAAAAGGAQTKSLACVLENTWRSTVGVACYGVLVTPFREIAGGVYLWVHDDDDVIGIGYANADADLAPLEAMVKSAR